MRGKPLLLARERKLVPREVHEVRRIAAVDDAEGGLEPEVRCVTAQQAIGDGVECARPGESRSDRRRIGRLVGSRPHRLRDDAPRAPDHLFRRTPGKRQQEQPLRRDTLEYQMRNAMGQRVRLAGSGAGNDEQRPGVEGAAGIGCAECGGHALRRIERAEPVAAIG